MGLIRKTLAVSTVGVIRPNSKKQRMNKKQLKEMRKQTLIMQMAMIQAAAEKENG
jgi:hypothetical protein